MGGQLAGATAVLHCISLPVFQSASFLGNATKVLATVTGETWPSGWAELPSEDGGWVGDPGEWVYTHVQM
jgi:hypothetical protein